MWPLLLLVTTFQTIIVNSTNPCFLNQTAGIDMFKNCGMGTDWVNSIMVMWQYISGGYFTFVLVAVLVLIIYIKYEKMIYAIYFGVIFLPISYFLFPVPLLSAVIIMMLVGLGLLLGYIFVNQTND